MENSIAKMRPHLVRDCLIKILSYVRINCNMDDHTLVEEVRKGFRKKHIYIYGSVDEDLRLLRKKFDRWKGGDSNENN